MKIINNIQLRQAIRLYLISDVVPNDTFRLYIALIATYFIACEIKLDMRMSSSVFLLPTQILSESRS